MNKCRFCNKAWIKTLGGSWEVCKCGYAQQEFKIEFKIQDLEKELIVTKKWLSELRKKYKYNAGTKL